MISFSKLNPDWQIFVYCPVQITVGENWDGFEQKSYNYQGVDYFERLSCVINLTLLKVDFKEVDESLSEVHKSDLLRLEILSTVGGIWSDFDIFYVKSINELSFNKNNKNKDTIVCYNNGYHSIGFLGSCKNNKFFEVLYKGALHNIKNIEKLQYQNIGRDLYNYFYRHETKEALEFEERYRLNIGNLPFTVIYPFEWNQIDLIFGQNRSLYENTIGIHWFAGSDKTSEIENIITEENIKQYSDKFLLNLMDSYEI